MIHWLSLLFLCWVGFRIGFSSTLIEIFDTNLDFLYPHVSLCLRYQDVEKYKLGNPRTFHYLNQSHCYELDGVDNSKEYLATRKAMDVVGISSDEQVLCLGSFLTGNIYMKSLLNFLLSGCNIPSSSCNTPFGQCWVHKGKRNRFFWTQRW